MPLFPLNTVLNAAQAKLQDAGAAPSQALSAAKAMVYAEAEGNPICGLFHMAAFCRQIAAGRVKGDAQPSVLNETPAALVVDAADGMAHPAFDFGIPLAVAKAKQTGLAALSVVNSYHVLALGQMTAEVARQGMVGLMFQSVQWHM